MIINKEGKLFGKISIIDIIVIVLLAVIAFGVYTRFLNPQGTQILDEDVELEYTLEIKDVPNGMFYALTPETILTDSVTKQPLGKIYTHDLEKTKDIYTFSDGTVKEFDDPQNHFDITLVVRVKGKIGDSGYYTADNNPLHIGTELSFYTKQAEASGTITSINKIED